MINKGVIPLILSLWAIMGSNPAWSQVVDQNQCLLTYMPSGRSSVAVSLVQRACNYLSFSTSTWKANEGERLYNECLLLNLGHVNNDNAAFLISQVCYDQYRSRFHFH
jgi:hypothetical protein